MKLLILASTYPRWVNDHEPGFVHELAKRLVGNFDVTVLCPHALGAAVYEEMDGVSVIRFRYGPGPLELLVNNGGIVNNLLKKPWLWAILPCFFASMAFSIFRLNRQFRPDVIHAHWIIPQGLVIALLKMLGVRLPPILLTSHGGDLYSLDRPVFRRLKRWVISNVAAFTVVSEAMRRFALGLGVPREHVSVRSMGVDLKKRFRLGHESPGGKPNILFVGRFVEKKGVDVLLDSLPFVRKEVLGVSVTLVGYGPEEVDLKKRSCELGLAEIVRFAGAQSQESVAGFYREASVLAAPFVRAQSGDADGLGLVVAEALASGCPVVTSDLPATADLTFGMEGVLTVPEGDSQALASALVGVLQSRTEWKQRAANDRVRLVRQLDWSFVADDYGRRLASLVKASV
ncbi:glycosyltransferase [Marinobacter sp.]|uniref:glycosyltransferase n=1 Tax=Marinobacter sp. TaxID=50741 RepID=UPI002B26FBC4|nr:glycosyltransferase [Marinobacter sp.]